MTASWSGQISSALQASDSEGHLIITFAVAASGSNAAAPQADSNTTAGMMQLFVYGHRVPARHTSLSFGPASQLPDGSWTAAVQGHVQHACTTPYIAPAEVYGRLHMTPAGDGWLAGSVVLVHHDGKSDLQPSLLTPLLRTAADDGASAAAVAATSSSQSGLAMGVAGYDVQTDLSVQPVYVASFTLHLESAEGLNPALSTLVPGLSIAGSLHDADASSFVIDLAWLAGTISADDSAMPEYGWGQLSETSHVLQGDLGSSLTGFFAVQAAAGGLLHVTVAGMLTDTQPRVQLLDHIQWCRGGAVAGEGQLLLQLPDGSAYHAAVPLSSMHNLGFDAVSVVQSFSAGLAWEQQPPVHDSINASSAFQAMLHVGGQWWLFGADHVRASPISGTGDNTIGLTLSNGWARNMCSGTVTPMRGTLRVVVTTAGGTLVVASGLMALQTDPPLSFDGQVMPSSFSHLLHDSPTLTGFEPMHSDVMYRVPQPDQQVFAPSTSVALQFVHDTAQGLVAVVCWFKMSDEVCDVTSLFGPSAQRCLPGSFSLFTQDGQGLQLNISLGSQYDSWVADDADVSATIMANGRLVDSSASTLQLASGDVVKLSGRASLHVQPGVHVTVKLLAWYAQATTPQQVAAEDVYCTVAPADQPAIGSASGPIGSASASLVVWPTQMRQHMLQYMAFGLAGSVALPSSDAPLAAAAAQYASLGGGGMSLLLPVPGDIPYRLSLEFGALTARLVANTSVGSDILLNHSSTLILEGWVSAALTRPCGSPQQPGSSQQSHYGWARVFVSEDGSIASGSEIQLFEVELVSHAAFQPACQQHGGCLLQATRQHTRPPCCCTAGCKLRRWLSAAGGCRSVHPGSCLRCAC